MIIVSPKRCDLQSAAAIASSAELKSVTLVRLSTKGANSPAPSADDARIEFGMEKFEASEPGRLTVDMALNVVMGKKPPSDDRPSEDAPQPLSFALTFRAEYGLPEDPVPAEFGNNALQHFAALNGLTNCWPYFRQELQHLTTLMGLAAFTLPSLVVRAASDEGDDSGVET